MDMRAHVDDALELADIAARRTEEEWQTAVDNNDHQMHTFYAATKLLGYVLGHESIRRGISFEDILTEIRLQALEHIE